MNKKKYNIEELFTFALELHQKKKFIDAEKNYKKILEINPNHFQTIFYLGTLFAQTGKLNLSKKFLEKTIKIHPEDINAYRNLGIVLKELGELSKSAICFKKVIEIQPKNTTAYNILGSVYAELGLYQEAFTNYKKSILIDQNNTLTINNLSVLLKEVSLSDITKISKENVREVILFLFKRKDVDHNDLFSKAILFFKNKYYDSEKINSIISSNAPLLSEKITMNLLKDELFLLMLQKSLITDYFFERILNKLRYEILFNISNAKKNILEKNFNFIISLAEQCFLNEYIFIQLKEEDRLLMNLKQSIKNDKKIDELKIAILACYSPLYDNNEINKKLINYKSKNNLFNDLINMQINEPAKEKRLINSIKSFGKIADTTSKKVRDQYEKNPYPRWRYIYKNLPSNTQTIIKSQIKPNKIEFKKKIDNPDILVAGCGTGKSILKAANYLNAKILGIDLSLTSLAYAKRKVEELGLKNINFLHADILELKNLNKKFDIIECAGVLHHMKKPSDGLKILSELLKPHGIIQLGLYSEIARKDIIEVKEFIKKKNYKASIENIRKSRKEIYLSQGNKLIQKVFYRKDFYSISTVRDLIFHVMEHRFTLVEISKMLKNLNLEFLGFTDIRTKKKYMEIFPKDTNSISLENWHKFEKDNPESFLGMYSFCIRKK